MSDELDAIVADLSDADKAQLKAAEPIERWKARLVAEEAAKLQQQKTKPMGEMTAAEFDAEKRKYGIG